MSCLDRPVLANTSEKIGTSISTPLVVPAVSRTLGAFAKPAIATSGIRTSQVVGEGFVGRVRLAGRLEVADVLQRRPPFVAGFPGRAHAHAILTSCASQPRTRWRNAMSAPSSRMYAATYGGLRRWPRNGTLTMQNVVTM